MANVVAKVEVKARVSGVDPARPKKETFQRFQTFTVKTKVIDRDEWEWRRMIAWVVLNFGTDFL